MFERNLYSPDFFNFYIDTMQNALEQELDLAVPATKFTADVVAHASNNRMLPDLIKILVQ
jgi:hypothetical protein